MTKRRVSVRRTIALWEMKAHRHGLFLHLDVPPFLALQTVSKSGRRGRINHDLRRLIVGYHSASEGSFLEEPKREKLDNYLGGNRDRLAI